MSPPRQARPLSEQISEVKGEILKRRRVYDELVSHRKMSRTRANRKILIMEAVLATLEGLDAAVNGTPKERT